MKYTEGTNNNPIEWFIDIVWLQSFINN